MRVSIQVSPDERLCIASERHVLGGRRKLVLLAGAVPGCVGLSLLFFGVEAWASAALLITLGLVDLTVLPLLLPRIRGRRWARSAGHPRLIEVTRDGVRTVHHTFELTRPWNLVDDVVELPNQYLLMLNRAHYIAIPTGRLSDSEHAELRTLLDRRGELVPA
jgi:hypothetical protein